MLKVENLSKTLGNFVIQDVSFEVGMGEYFVLLGMSGGGKTILLETIAGIFRPDAGHIRLAEMDITRKRIQKRGIGLVYQDQALFPHLTVYQNIAYGVSRKKPSGSPVHERVKDLANDVGAVHLLDRYPATLSGGEAQRVALARALATEPLCLLLDEPLSSLDIQSRSEIRGLLRKIHRRGQTVVHVTHDYEEAISLGTRIAIMEMGRITQVGSPQDVFASPRSEFVARFVGIRNMFKGELKMGRCQVSGVRGQEDEGGRRQESGDRGQVAEFVTNGVIFSILTDAESGAGAIIFRGEDVVISNTRPQTSARNTFEGTVMDIEPARIGCYVLVDIGVKVWALLTAGSIETLDLHCGRKVWVNFKASAVRFSGE